MTFLEVRGLRSGYDGSTVLPGVDLDLAEGETLALLGRNGVGKTTLVSSLCGLLRPSAGSVRLGGLELAGRSPDVASRAGVAVVPQGRRIFADLTVSEHLAVAVRVSRVSRKDEWDTRRVLDLLPRLGERLGHRGNQLSGGEQQMLAIARALLTNPRLMLLDEPSEGLAPAVVTQVGETVRDIVATGTAVLLVEQDLRLAFSLADEVAVMDKGRIVLRTTTQDFRSDSARARRLLGVG